MKGFGYTAEERLAEGEHLVTARVYDQAGNQTETGPWTFSVVDEGAPSLGVTKYYYHGSQRVAMRQEDVVYYLHGDHPSAALRAGLGSTSLTTDNSGTVVAETRYLPYGEERWTAGGAQPTDFTFTGQRAERGFGLMDYQARYYDPRLGRFVSADTVVPEPGNPQALNRYSYALNNPLRFVDPTGHQSEPTLWEKVRRAINRLLDLGREQNPYGYDTCGVFGCLGQGPPQRVFLIDPEEAEQLRQAVKAANTAAELASVVNQFGGLFNPEDIRYSQESYSPYGKIRDESGDWTGEWYSVEENIEFLRNNPDQDLPGGPIRIFVKEEDMDKWGPKTDYGHTGDPRNLENGQIYTLDHRRLVAYREAGRDSIPVQLATEVEIRRERYNRTFPLT